MDSYIVHHGIQGQKWGVRNAEWYPIADYKEHLRNRRETKAAKKAAKTQARIDKQNAKVQKHIDKNEAYRLKLADKNRKYSDMYKRQQEQAEKNVADITAKGKDSEAYRKYAKDQLRRNERVYETTHSVEVDGRRYVQKYDDSLKSVIDEYTLLDNPSANEIARALAKNMESAKNAKEFVELYESRAARLDNMTIDAKSKKIKTWMKSIWG